jgi:hypothetical protein
MIKFLSKKNNHDLLNQFHYIRPLQKTKLVQASFNTNNNKLINHNKFISPLYFFINSLLSRKPFVKVTKRSYAAFKIRPNMIIGTKNHLHNQYLVQFYYTFISTMINQFKPKFTSHKNGKSYSILISFPSKDLKNSIVTLNTLDSNFNHLGGAHIQFYFVSPVPCVPFYYFHSQKSKGSR